MPSSTDSPSMNDTLDTPVTRQQRASAARTGTDAQTAPAPAAAPRDRVGGRVLGAFIDALTPGQAVDTILGWARARESRTVCFVNVHSVVTSRDDASMHDALASADLCLPDGAPVAWHLRHGGFPGQQRVCGPDTMTQLLARAEADGIGVFFYGSAQSTLDALSDAIRRDYPALSLRGAFSPPYRQLAAEELAEHVAMINASGAGLVFIGLGCPKQEKWMAQQHGSIRGVCLGVGAAFDFLAGTTARAPSWMRACGLEWLHRLSSEPGRLARRYAETNLKFVALTLAERLTGTRRAR